LSRALASLADAKTITNGMASMMISYSQQSWVPNPTQIKIDQSTDPVVRAMVGGTSAPYFSL